MSIFTKKMPNMFHNNFKVILRSFKYFPLVFVLLLLWQPAISSVAAQPDVDFNPNMLSTPRKAAFTFMHWQQDGHKQPEFVAKTMQIAESLSTEQRYERAQKLRQLLDARGLLVDYEEIPNKPNYTDSLSGLPQYILFPELPEIYLMKKDSIWVFSKASVQAIPDLYADTFSFFVENILNNLPEMFKQPWLGLEIWQYFALFFWLLAGLLVRKLIEFFLQNYIKRLASKTKTEWDDNLILSIDKPAGFIFMMVFYWLTASNLQLSIDFNYYLINGLEVAISAGIIWLIYRFVDLLADMLTEVTFKTESKLDDQLVPLVRKSLKILIVIIGVLFILQNNGINVASLLAGLGLGGLAFALAARDTLANFFGSVTIFIDKPFQIGDWVKTGNVEGTVEEVGFRSTRIRTFYNSLISVPNSTLANTDVDNLGLRKYRRVKMMLNLTYDTPPEKLEAFVEGIKAIIVANKHMWKDFYEVHFNQFGPHSLDVLVYCFLEVPSWSDELQQKHNFFMEILRLAKDIGVSFAFPTQTLHVDSFKENGDSEHQNIQAVSESELAATIFRYGPGGEKSSPEGVRLYKDGDEVDFGANTKHRGS